MNGSTHSPQQTPDGRYMCDAAAGHGLGDCPYTLWETTYRLFNTGRTQESTYLSNCALKIDLILTQFD